MHMVEPPGAVPSSALTGKSISTSSSAGLETKKVKKASISVVLVWVCKLREWITLQLGDQNDGMPAHL